MGDAVITHGRGDATRRGNSTLGFGRVRGPCNRSLEPQQGRQRAGNGIGSGHDVNYADVMLTVSVISIVA